MTFLDYTSRKLYYMHRGNVRYFSIITKNERILNVGQTHKNPELEVIMIKDHLTVHTK